jgi:plasmid stabilization system protein ParE
VNLLIWTDSAKFGLAEIFDPFVIERPEFITSAMAQISRLESLLIDTPGIGAPVGDDGLRKLRVGRTPIIMICQVEGSRISIVRVHHGSQNWRK